MEQVWVVEISSWETYPLGAPRLGSSHIVDIWLGSSRFNGFSDDLKAGRLLYTQKSHKCMAISGTGR
jgi:hypothetical protein